LLTARDIMNDQVVSARPEWSVIKVLDLLLDEDIGSLPIIDDNGRIVGLVTESELLVAAFDPQLQADPVSLHMQRRFIEANPEESVEQLAEKFLLHRVRHFPVVEDQKFLGIINRRQLLRAILGRKKPNKMAS
jgi:CBS domain-containing protein